MVLRAIGAAILTGGLGLGIRCALLLVGRGRPRRGARPAFVLAGPYRRCRNPLLGAMVIAWAGSALLVRSPRMGGLTLVLATMAHLWVIFVEEPRLLVRHGAAYRAYVRKVGRWLPKRGRPSDPLS